MAKFLYAFLYDIKNHLMYFLSALTNTIIRTPVDICEVKVLIYNGCKK